MRYKFANASGSTPFFTVNLAERRTDLLVRHIDDLRATMKMVKDAHPFAILAAKKKRLAFAHSRSQNAPPAM
jgi:putative transposase